MQKIRINTAIIALIAFVLMLTIVSTSFTTVTFAMEDKNGNRFTYPVPAFKREGPSPWLYSAGSNCAYNLSRAEWNPYSTVPKTPHVLWTAPLEGTNYGGIIGGFNPDQGVYKDFAFSDSISLPVVALGKVFVRHLTFPPGTGGEIICFDEETGEYLWTSPHLASAGSIQIFNFVTEPSGQPSRGDIAVVVPQSNGWACLSVVTGQLMTTIAVSPSPGILKFGWQNAADETTAAYGSSGGEFINLRSGSAYRIRDFEGDVESPNKLLWSNPNITVGYHALDRHTGVGYDTDTYEMQGWDLFTGQLLWEHPFTTWDTGSIGYGKFYILGEDNFFYAFDARTGAQVWRSSEPFASFTNQQHHFIGNGMIIGTGWDGTVRAFNAETGQLIWKYYKGDCPFEPYKSWYGTWPSNVAVAGGIDACISVTTDHMMHNPPVGGERLDVLDINNGTLWWTFPINGYGVSDDFPYAIADGMIFCDDYYTGQMLAFGKGPSGIEVSVEKSQIAKGEYTWITGKVTDQSPGQVGTPCVSKEDMGAWMQYLHCGLPAPPLDTMTGVPVTLYAEAASTGTQIALGTVITDADSGMFTMLWTPPTEDLYTITAIFMGDDSYWMSNESTTLSVTTGSVSSSSTSSVMTVATLAAVVVGAITIQKRPLRKKEETPQ